MGEREVRAMQEFARRHASKPRPLRDWERTAYGFLSLEAGHYLKDQTWQMQPKQCFRPTGILVWPAGERDGVRAFERRSAMIESVLVGTDEQLLGGRGVPAGAFRVPITPESFLRHYLQNPTDERYSDGRVVLIGARIKTTPLDGPSWLSFPTIHPALCIRVRFSGALVGLVVVGHELVPSV